MKALLCIFSVLYGFGVGVRNLLFDLGILYERFIPRVYSTVEHVLGSDHDRKVFAVLIDYIKRYVFLFGTPVGIFPGRPVQRNP